MTMSIDTRTPGTDAVLPPIDPACASLPFAQHAASRVLNEVPFHTILDVGSGSGAHSRLFASRGKRVTAIDLGRSVYYTSHGPKVHFVQGSYLDTTFSVPFDVVWASHVLEHQPNPNLFIRRLFADCRTDGMVAITVPPLKHKIVGGHVTLWNAGLLLYQIVIAGYSCSEASILKYGYNISVLVRKTPIDDLPDLTQDHGDIERLARFFPAGCREGFNGDIQRLNW